MTTVQERNKAKPQKQLSVFIRYLGAISGKKRSLLPLTNPQARATNHKLTTFFVLLRYSAIKALFQQTFQTKNPAHILRHARIFLNFIA